jgi:hypothetical protein
MNYLDKISDRSFLRFFLTGNPGQRIILTLRFMPSQNMWFMDIEYETIIINGIAVVASPNLLRNSKNILPFGICCNTTSGLDPYFVDDFATERANLYLLSQADVDALEAQLFE